MKRSGFKRHLKWLIPVLVVDVIAVLYFRLRPANDAGGPATVAVPAVPRTPPPWRNLVFPTDQPRLLEPDAPGVFQPTASGRLESALFGSVRTRQSAGGGILPSFHEGIDIAAMSRDRAGRPLDKVHAVAPGEVAYVNRVGGNSNYGIYVLVRHDDPIGPVYTLYAHLASAGRDIAAGRSVAAGQELGVMGNTASSGIPMERAHLHFEIGLMINSRFGAWYRAQKLTPDHGNFHGRNFLGVDPLAFLEHQRHDPDLDFGSHLAAVPAAFDLLLRPARLDFFRRYPSLWEGPPFDGGAVVLTCSENGLPLKGRGATDAEAARLAASRPVVLSVNEAVLGRNGCRLVVPGGSGWQLGKNGEEWLRQLTY